MRCLSDAPIGESVRVTALLARDLIKERMLALGITKGTEIEVIRKGPKENLTVFAIRGAMVALRKEEAKLILISD
ncbi:MAG TPA: FeoA family protein [Bacilli bacterium]